MSLDVWLVGHRAASRSEPVRRVHPAVEHAARLLRDDAAPTTVHELAARVNMSPRLPAAARPPDPALGSAPTSLGRGRAGPTPLRTQRQMQDKGRVAVVFSACSSDRKL